MNEVMQALACQFRPMVLSDIPEVVQLERLCFHSPWSADTFRLELSGNRFARYWVLAPEPDEGEALPPILAYGGYWLTGDEAHIVNVASHPDFRRQGFGRQIMQAMMAMALDSGAFAIMLEVRQSNVAAQRLYEQLGFITVGERREYYQDNKEDAILMTYFAALDA